MIRIDPLLQIAALKTKYSASHALVRCRKAAPAPHARGERPRRGGMSPKQKRALKALESGNALHERNGLSSHGLHRSTFGDGELNCRVRHGTG